MKGQDIICFAKDRSEDPTSNNHVMHCLAKNNKVLWLNSIALRTPDFTNKRDLKKIYKKVKEFFSGYEQIEKNMWVYTPIVIPLPHNPFAIFLNRLIIKSTIAFLKWKLGMNNCQLWTFLPTMNEYVDELDKSVLVYYCTDEHSQFSYLDTEKILEKEVDLIKKADVVFATSNMLLERKKHFNPKCYLASHGVGHNHFSKALASETPIPDDIKDIPPPVLGFFGLIHDWIDLNLIEYIAKQRPEWNIVMIGQANVNVDGLMKLPNVYMLGRRKYEELPGYCKAFSLGLIPFIINELTVHVNPIKLKEYLSAGLPVVSTPLPEVQYYDCWCSVESDYDKYLMACEQTLESTTIELKHNLSEMMREESWEVKVEKLGEQVMKVLNNER